MHAETAAPGPGVVPIASPGSPPDAAAATIATGMATKSATLTADLARKSPQLQAATQQGVAHLQAQDEHNANQIRQLGQNPPRDTRPHSGIFAADNHTFKQGPPPSPKPPPPGNPNPANQLNLPNYNPGTLSPDEARTVYLQGEQRMRQLNEQLMRQGVSPEQRAQMMFDLRNQLRSWSRDLMSDRALAGELNANEPNLTLDQLIAKNQAKGLAGDDVWNSIIDSSTRSRGSVNAKLGIDPAHPPDLPPVRPAPVEPGPVGPPPASAPAEPPLAKAPPVEPAAPKPVPPMEGGEGPMIGGPTTPIGPHVVHPPHSIPHHFPILGEDDPWENPRDFE